MGWGWRRDGGNIDGDGDGDGDGDCGWGMGMGNTGREGLTVLAGAEVGVVVDGGGLSEEDGGMGGIRLGVVGVVP